MGCTERSLTNFLRSPLINTFKQDPALFVSLNLWPLKQFVREPFGYEL